jgi:hypothetical protein
MFFYQSYVVERHLTCPYLNIGLTLKYPINPIKTLTSINNKNQKPGFCNKTWIEFFAFKNRVIFTLS